MTITFLGTGTSQGVPMIGCDCEVCTSTDPKDKRLRTSVMLEMNGRTIVIDTGPDFRQQMLREEVKKIDAVVFTHEHKDHIAGLDDVRAFNYLIGKSMDVFATSRVQEALRREFFYVFNGDNYPGIPKLNLHTIELSPFDVHGIKFIPVEVKHMNLPVLGFRIGDFSYITDANFIPDTEKGKLMGSKVLVINALRRTKHVSHFNLDEALELISELKPKQAYLIHLSHQMGTHENINSELPENVRCAFDRLKIEIL